MCYLKKKTSMYNLLPKIQLKAKKRGGGGEARKSKWRKRKICTYLYTNPSEKSKNINDEQILFEKEIIKK